ncbi:MerR family transcriptional regulator [Massilimicrobiota sp. An142]|uniref:MerR family transcriptional regulator n=1 Tax=unclassified Massilimicrobiota TaxID=2619866 RepID=UPI000B390D3B|nr:MULTISPECIES: MerR family transcriptional regulator [unclassified Massilimicrobiota]MEE0778836.1 MerR family transcriptional regulator [Massilimicrobiota sp.]OUQ14396.1 MerR family transcriptional regulator [Massilimicrobiota sp. An142]OUQ80726.1 MerR family transcriptional regulator [Massilimicrobiota sp. An105]
MNYYKTGEFAKKASISIRTVRYYDKKGLLKPSLIDTNGYRLYTDKDFEKLQKILSLKYLGFSLDDIFAMTANDSYLSLKQSLDLQMKLIQQKIETLQSMQSFLQEAQNTLIHNEKIEWSEFMKNIQMDEMEKELVEQYRNATNIDIRMRLHDKYSINPISWFRWLFSYYCLHEDSCVLEIGCGNGQLWKENQELIQGHIVLSDISQGMVDDAKKNLENISDINYQCFDCLNIPYPDESFDIVIANHVFFYLKDLNQALKEIQRILKPGGYLYCSTYGSQHMKEITDLVKEYNPKIVLSNRQLYDVFGLDNGKDILLKYFTEVKQEKYEDHLEVDNMDDIANYILSCHGNQSEYISKDYMAFKKFLDRKLSSHSHFYITKDAGMFICQK